MISTDKEQKSPTRRLTTLYISSLAVVACLSIAGQFIIQRLLSQQQVDIQVISNVQHQQILSQRLAKLALALKLTQDENRRQTLVKDFEQTIVEWETTEENLEQLETSVNASPGRSVKIRNIIEQIHPNCKKMVDAAKQLLSTAKTGKFQPRVMLSQPLRQISASERQFEKQVDRVISEYNQYTAQAVTELKHIEMALLVLTLLVLISEGFLIFQPAVEQLRTTFNKLTEEQKKSEHLLLNILPETVANRLKEQPTTIAEAFAEVTVLFADIVGFTQLSTQVSPQELVGLLNQIFSAFDELAEKHGLEKIKTIGDAYMVVGGLPNPQKDHAEAIVKMALDMQQAIKKFNVETGSNCNIRIGINTGPVVAGVIGIKKFIYDLWGDTVNIASRMESHGIPGNIQISQTTYEIIKDKFTDTFTNQYLLESRGLIEIKGKGEMQTYLVVGKDK
ncbi:family 3 adenylate cyclase [Rivularia sp. PCC 7116]|uniref:adenylate/guanylate cyclase domain-containing protein n=1 Tax=Rivularia sp. PCC 7116 TaxID=373994 RepID=UPI00029EE3E7|nr:adenylate/guanylate cyclase domain-containing protein [Rivularia sp. PCC 7116]AFY55567.1 family 3 adenylate cyclase [Rivularia sp. PCC 7116]